MTAAQLLDLSSLLAMGILALAMLLAILRLILGPSVADRILALDLLMTLALGFIVAFAVHTGFALYLDIAIALGLLGFLSTVAFARYLMTSKGDRREIEEPQ